MTITDTVLFYISLYLTFFFYKKKGQGNREDQKQNRQRQYEVGSGTFSEDEEQCFIVWTKLKRLC